MCSKEESVKFETLSLFVGKTDLDSIRAKHSDRKLTCRCVAYAAGSGEQSATGPKHYSHKAVVRNACEFSFFLFVFV